VNEDDKKGLLAKMFGGWNRTRENALADIGLGFVPIAGTAADVQDAKRAIENRDLVGLGLAGVGFVPGVGDAVKAAGKGLRRAVSNLPMDEASRLARARMFDDLEDVQEVLRITPVRGPQNLKFTPSSAESVNERILENVARGGTERASLLSALEESTRYGARADRSVSPNLASLQSLLEGRVSGVDPRVVAREYIDAAKMGIPLDARSIERRAGEMFPLRAYHGTRQGIDTGETAFNLRPTNLSPPRDPSGLPEIDPKEMMTAFFTGINRGGRELADEYRKLSTSLGLSADPGTVLPLRVNPGRTLDLDVGGSLFSHIQAADLASALNRSGVDVEDILDAIADSDTMLAGQYERRLRDLAPEFQDYIFDAVEGTPGRYSDNLYTRLETDEAAQIANSLGFDSTLFRDVIDTPGPGLSHESVVRMPGFGSDVLAVHDPAGRIRHESAVFNPEKLRSRNIFSGIAGATIGSAALARAMNQNRQEEY